jgi:hypothetical protein
VPAFLLAFLAGSARVALVIARVMLPILRTLASVSFRLANATSRGARFAFRIPGGGGGDSKVVGTTNVGGVHVGIVLQGARDLDRAFSAHGREFSREFRKALRDAAEPIAREAEYLAGSGGIRNLDPGDPWATFRIGGRATSVFLAPTQRGSRGGRSAMSRPNLKPLLLDQAMIPSIEHQQHEVKRRVNDVLGRSIRRRFG